MRFFRWILGSAACIALIFSSVLSLAAQASTSIQILRINTANHPHIEAVISVLDASGRPVIGLTAADFAVYEDGKQVPLMSATSITDQNIPLADILVIDTSTSMAGPPLDAAKAAAIAFVNQVPDVDELALISFNSTITVAQTPTKDRAAVINKIKALQVGGETALYDALAKAVSVAQQATAQRRDIVLLTDGAEYGGLSKTKAEEAYQLADKARIPVFTIGLGYGIDQDYLKAVASHTGGEFYLSPKLDDLKTIYGKIGTLLRSLYVLDFDTALPADGATHKIRIELKARGASAEGSARYPAPVPVIKFGGIDASKPLDKPTAIVPQIVADNTITGYEYQIDGTSASSGTGATVKPLTIDPLKLTPGLHHLKLSVTDDKGHTGQATLDFQVAPLPPVFTIQGMADGETLNADRTVTLNVTASQTPVSGAMFDIDGTPIGSPTQAPYGATISVLALAPGQHKLTAQLKNQGATGTQSFTFTIPPGPRQTATMASLLQATHFAQQTLTALPTSTPIPSATPTSTPSPSETETAVPVAIAVTDTLVPTVVPTLAPSETATPLPTSTPLPTDTALPTATYTPSSTDTPVPTSTFTPTNTFTPTATLTATQTDTPTFTPTPTPTLTPTPVPPLTQVVNYITTPTGILCLGGLAVLFLILLVLFGRRRTPPPPARR